MLFKNRTSLQKRAAKQPLSTNTKTKLDLTKQEPSFTTLILVECKYSY